MNPIDDLRRERVQNAPSDSTPPPPADDETSRGATDEQMQALVDSLPTSPDYSALFTNLSARTPATGTTLHAKLESPTLGKAGAALQARLDAFRDSFSGPYNVGGAAVLAPPMFRINTSDAFNAESARAHAGALAAICKRAGISADMGPVTVGRGTPAQLVRVTQALIDANKLPPADAQHPTMADRIRLMQWTWGIGVDCAGYTQQAAAAAHPGCAADFLANPNGDIFSNMKNNRRFEKVDAADLHPGDVLHLDGDPGHNVICRSHTPLDDAERTRLMSAPGLEPGARAFLSGSGPFHSIEVDSSWGADDGNMYGGYRRDIWLYDESTKKWASFPKGDQSAPLEVADNGGPQGEKFAGAFRPKANP